MAKTTADSAKNQMLGFSSDNKNLQSIINQFDVQISALEKQKETAAQSTPPAANAANGTNELTSEELEANWMTFSFDSKTSKKSTSTESNSYSASLDFSVGGLGWSVGGGASYSRSQQDFAEQMSSADISVSAKFLRVTFSRNWFRPSLFKTGKLKMVSVNYNNKLNAEVTCIIILFHFFFVARWHQSSISRTNGQRSRIHQKS